MSGEWYLLSTKEDTSRGSAGVDPWTYPISIYKNDLPNCLEYATPRLFADDTSITVAGKLVKDPCSP